MEKPISMILNETKLGLANICNQSGLPSYMLEPILKELYLEAKELAKQQLKQDEEMYKASLNKENKQETNKQQNNKNI